MPQKIEIKESDLRKVLDTLTRDQVAIVYAIAQIKIWKVEAGTPREEAGANEEEITALLNTEDVLYATKETLIDWAIEGVAHPDNLGEK